MNFKKRPVTIQAIQFDGSTQSARLIADTFDNGKLALDGWLAKASPAYTRPTGARLFFDSDENELRIFTLEGIVSAKKGDWVIRGIKGELYPCKPDIFAATYESTDPRGSVPSLDAWEADTEQDLPLVEDDEIRAAHPLNTGRHDLYATATRLVGARKSKGALVDLVVWLLLKAESAAKGNT